VTADAPACPCCGTALSPLRAGFRRDCPRCGFASATLPVAIAGAAAALREDERAAGLAALRTANFERVLDRLAACGVRPPGALLEVGCAHGWFLDAARRRGYTVLGIEPDGPIGAIARARRHDVRDGFFPAALPHDARFDAIVFNDVFEHLPDPRSAMAAAAASLAPQGLLAINLPSNRGALYRVAAGLRIAGWRGPHDRMWQVGFPSPHLSYFNPDALARLAAATGLREVDRQVLPSVARDGLWRRIRSDAGASWLTSAATWCAVSVALPLLRRLPADITLQLFAPSQRPAPGTSAAGAAGDAGNTSAIR